MWDARIKKNKSFASLVCEQQKHPLKWWALETGEPNEAVGFAKFQAEKLSAKVRE